MKSKASLGITLQSLMVHKGDKSKVAVDLGYSTPETGVSAINRKIREANLKVYVKNNMFCYVPSIK